MASFKAWFETCRPKTLPAAISPVLIGCALAYSDGCWNTLIAVVIMLAAIAIQIGTNFANDFVDVLKGVDTEERIGPKRAIHRGEVTTMTMLLATVVAFGVVGLLGLYLVYHGGIPILIIGCASILAGILYTAGPFPLNHIGLADIAVVVFFGPVAVGGTYYLLTDSFSLLACSAGFAPGLVATGILAVNNYRDRYTDAKAGRKTLVIRFGERFGRLEYVVCVIAGVLVPAVIVLASERYHFSLVSLIMLIPGIKASFQMDNSLSGEEYNQLLGQTGKILILHSLLFVAGLLV